MNALVVPDGTYEVCSRTINALANDPLSNAKWILNVKWQMQGIDIHLDTNIGKRLSALGGTLNVLYGQEEDDVLDTSMEADDAVLSDKVEPMQRRTSVLSEGLPDFVYDASLDPKTRARLIEKEMNAQAKTVEFLKQFGASQHTVESEAKKLQELETCLFLDFRQDLMKKLKKQGEKASALKDKLGLGYKPAVPARPRTSSVISNTNRLNQKRKDFKMEGRRLQSCHEDAENVYPHSSPAGTAPPPGHQRAFSLDVSTLASPRVTIDGPHGRRDYLSTTLDDPTQLNFDLDSSENSPSSPVNMYLGQFEAGNDREKEGEEDNDVDVELLYLQRAAEG